MILVSATLGGNVLMQNIRFILSKTNPKKINKYPQLIIFQNEA